MRRIYHFIKAVVHFARHPVWVDEGEWSAADSVALTTFFNTQAGVRFEHYLRRVIVLQQSQALSYRKPDDLVYEAGYSAGQKSLAAAIDALRDHTKFTEQGDTEADPALNREAS